MQGEITATRGMQGGFIEEGMTIPQNEKEGEIIFMANESLFLTSPFSLSLFSLQLICAQKKYFPFFFGSFFFASLWVSLSFDDFRI